MSGERAVTAHHEAGHAVVVFLLGGRVLDATIVSDAEAAGCVHFEAPTWARGWVQTRIGRSLVKRDPRDHKLTIVAAGPEAETLFTGERNEEHARSDCQMERDLVNELGIAHFGLDPEKWEQGAQLRYRQERRLQRVRNSARAMVTEHWSDVRSLASELLTKHPWMSGDRVHQFLEGLGIADYRITPEMGSSS